MNKTRLFLFRIFGVLLILVVVGGCGSVKDLALKSASGYMNCPESELEAKWIDVRTYRVTGCANSAVFVCSKWKKKCKREAMSPF